MLVDLRSLKPNPIRDFKVDPLDAARIAELTKSIKDDGFWGGIVCRRRPDGVIEIAAGHHRVQAAIMAGVDDADVFVSDDMDDDTMLRVYARENATQRGNIGTAQVGSVAGALRLIVKRVLTGLTSGQLAGRSLETIRGQIASEKGVGRDVIVEHLAGTPDINDKTVRQAIANIKASGDYARIITEVQEEIERENAEALEALRKAEEEQRDAEEKSRQAEQARKDAAAAAEAAREEAAKKRAEEDRKRAEEAAKLAKKRRKEAKEAMKGFKALKKTRDTAVKAAHASNGQPITFDLSGVAKHLRNPSQIDTFREMVTGEGVRPYLAVNQQAALAEHLVRLAAESDEKGRTGELSSQFIRDNLMNLVLQVKAGERAEDRKKKEELLMRDRIKRAKDHQHQFSRAIGSATGYAHKITKLWESWPEGEPFPVLDEFRDALETAKQRFDALQERIGHVHA